MTVWRRLWTAMVLGNMGSAGSVCGAEAFLRWFVEGLADLADQPIGRAPMVSNVARRIAWAERGGRAPAEEDVRRFDTLRAQMLDHFPDADDQALRWLCDVPGLQQWCERNVSGAATPGVPGVLVEALEALGLWVRRYPSPGAAEAMGSSLRRYVDALAPWSQAGPSWGPHPGPAMYQLVGALATLQAAGDGPAQARSHEVLGALLEAVPPQPNLYPFGGGAGRFTTIEHLLHVVAPGLAPGLAAGGLLQGEALDRLLMRLPNLPNLIEAGVAGPAAAATSLSPCSAWHAEVAASVGRMLDRALAAGAGEADASVRAILWCYDRYAGFDHYLAGVRALAQQAGREDQAAKWLDPRHPLAWLPRLFLHIQGPRPADALRAAELAAQPPAALLAAALLAPEWAHLAESHLDWPGLGAVALWLKRSGWYAPWRAYQAPSADEDEAGGARGDSRAAALEGAASMGETRLRRLLRHPVVGKYYPHGVFYLQAALGQNAAEVEAGFLKRNKRAVRALGMLPDEGDLLQRYAALRRLAKEARQFGPQRQASEGAAAAAGLAELAVTAGYLEVSQLEWAMEAQLAQEVDPAARRWSVAGYTVWIATVAPASAAGGTGGSGVPAEIAVERGGKRLKSVPAAVRQAAEYVEVREARDALVEQFDRVRRRLELAMALGEVMDYQSFAPALTTLAGRAMAPRLVLRCRQKGNTEPVDLLDFRTLAGEAVAPEEIERFQVAHPVHLAEAGTLQAWQGRLVAGGQAQPFNQLFRPLYLLRDDERDAGECTRLAGRQARLGALIEHLKRHGWRVDSRDGFSRTFPRRVQALLGLAQGAPYLPRAEVVTVGALSFHGPNLDPPFYTAHLCAVDPIHFSEALREADLATAAAALDRTAVPVSPETLAARAALARTLVPGVRVEADLARVGGHAVHLHTGAAYGPDGAPIILPTLGLPLEFPYPDPDAATADIIARLIHLSRAPTTS